MSMERTMKAKQHLHVKIDDPLWTLVSGRFFLKMMIDIYTVISKTFIHIICMNDSFIVSQQISTWLAENTIGNMSDSLGCKILLHTWPLVSTKKSTLFTNQFLLVIICFTFLLNIVFST